MLDPSPSMVCLMVLDGWGVAQAGPANAVTLADTPNLDRLFMEYPNSTLLASGEAVGLPPGQMGNSEVGHLNLGAGRVVYQDLTRINLAIRDGSFFNNRELLGAFGKARDNSGSVHLMGLLSDGGVHSDITHLQALIEMAQAQDCDRLFLHLFLDGRDVSPTSGLGYVKQIVDFIRDKGLGKIATISGRFYAMDRDHRWDRVHKAYDAIVRRKGPHSNDPEAVVSDSYKENVTDEFVIPTVIGDDPDAAIKSNDSVIFFNFRPDRARQLTRALTFKDFPEFDRGANPPLPYLVTMTEYDAIFESPIAFPPEELINVLAAVLADAGRKQLHIAETEKYAHVTFFFNGGVEKPYPGETRKLIPSPTDVSTYDQKPEMSAYQVTDTLISMLDEERFDFIIVNLANCDMVGHTGKLDAAIKAVEVVDDCVGRIAEKVSSLGGVSIITADHGNAEKMKDDHDGPDTAHTSDPVPIIITAPVDLTPGCALGDVAPTILKFLGIEVPPEMTGRCII